MNSLKEIRTKVLHMTIEDMRIMMDVSRQLLYSWESGRAIIPAKRLMQLEELTGIPERFFKAPFLSEDALKQANKYRLEKEYGKPLHLEEEEEELEEADEIQTSIDKEIIEEIEYSLKKLDVEALQEKIAKIIYTSNDREPIYNDIVEDMEEKRNAIERFADIVAETRQRKTLFQILRTMELFFGVNEKKYQFWGEDLLMRNDIVSDQTPMIRELLRILNKNREKEIEDLNERIRELQATIRILKNE